MSTARWPAHWSRVIALWLGPWWYPVTATAAEQHPGGMPMWGWHMMEGGWGWGMMLMMVLFWAAIIIAIICLIRWLIVTSKPRQISMPAASKESALDILKRLYARGEVSKQEFAEIRQDMQS